MSGASIVSLEHVQKAFGGHRIYTDLCLEVSPGEALTVIGGSGCGKSVMLKMIDGLIEADAGEIRVGGVALGGLSEAQLIPIRRTVGVVFQQGALFDSLTVRENVAYPLREQGWHDEAQISQRVAEVLGRVDLEGTEAMMPADLSGGMRKRVAIARAIAARPAILLYDEPTTGLDPINVRRINELIIDLNRDAGVTSIVVTHDLPTAYMVSDRMALLHDGRIVAIGPVAEFKRSPVGEVRDFLSAMDLAANEEVAA